MDDDAGGSRNRQTVPVAIPVVRESDWLSGTSSVVLPQLRANQRATLRYYADIQRPTAFSVNNSDVTTRRNR